MTYQDINGMIASIGTPYAYYQFPEGTAQPCPFICFYYRGRNDLMADDRNYAEVAQLVIELYTDDKDFALEQTVENMLTENDIPYSKMESYIDSEKMIMQTYESEVYIDG